MLAADYLEETVAKQVVITLYLGLQIAFSIG